MFWISHLISVSALAPKTPYRSDLSCKHNAVWMSYLAVAWIFPPIETKGSKTMKTAPEESQLHERLSLLVLAKLNVYDKCNEWRKCTAWYVTPTCPFRGSLPLRHSTLTLSLTSVSLSSAKLLLPESAIPSPQSSPAWKTDFVTKKETNLSLWNLSQSREEPLCNPLSSLCVRSCPKCFLQNWCDRESGFLCWSLCS